MTDATATTTSVMSAKATQPTNPGAGPTRLTVGIDLGDRHSHLCVLDSDGAILEARRKSKHRSRTTLDPPARF